LEQSTSCGELQSGWSPCPRQNALGAAVGIAVGTCVGDADGRCVGATVGAVVGRAVGTDVGLGVANDKIAPVLWNVTDPLVVETTRTNGSISMSSTTARVTETETVSRSNVTVMFVRMPSGVRTTFAAKLTTTATFRVLSNLLKRA
jgi:hypothetical protein